MLTPLAKPPKIIVADTGGDAAARANPSAIVLDREARCLRRGRDKRRVSLRTDRVLGLTSFILGALPSTEVSRTEAARAAGITTADDFSMHLRQVRHNLSPFVIGIESTWGGSIVLTQAEAASC